jgi:hypothetical protein
MAQQTDSQLRAEATVITTETTPGANTANRVGTMFTNSIDSKINNDVISANTALGTSDSLIPTQNAVKTYADGLVVGLLDDRGNFTPGGTSGSSYPTTGGSGTGGAIRKGDLWFIDANGYLGSNAVAVGTSVRALVDNPGSLDDEDWNILNTGFAFTPENVVNKSTNVALGNSDILYPTQKAVRDYVVNSGFAILNDANVYGNTNTFNDIVTFTSGVNISDSFTTGSFPITINGSTGTTGQILTSQGGAAAPTWEDSSTSGWGLTGNAGTAPGTDFIGTTDNQDLVFKTNNAEQLRFKSTEGSGNIETSYDVYSKNNLGGSLISAKSTGSNGGVTIGWDDANKGYAIISNGTAQGTIKATNLTTNQAYQFPNASGTLALEGYKSYVAIVTFTISGFTQIVLKNDFSGITFTWSNPTVNILRITPSTATTFTNDKTVAFVNSYANDYLVTPNRANNPSLDYVDLAHTKYDGTKNTMTFGKFYIEIRVYP